MTSSHKAAFDPLGFEMRLPDSFAASLVEVPFGALKAARVSLF
jgi:hypothetical protein